MSDLCSSQLFSAGLEDYSSSTESCFYRTGGALKSQTCIPGQFESQCAFWRWNDFFERCETFFLIPFLYGQIITIANMFSYKRKNWKIDVLKGRPSLPRVGDLLMTKKSRVIWILNHMFFTETIFNILFNKYLFPMPFGAGVITYQAECSGYVECDWAEQLRFNTSNVVWRIIVLVIYAIYYMPLYVATADQSLFNTIWILPWLIWQMVMRIVFCVLGGKATGTVFALAGADYIGERVLSMYIPTIFVLATLIFLFSKRVFELLKKATRGDESFLTKLFISKKGDALSEISDVKDEFSDQIKSSYYYRDTIQVLNQRSLDESYSSYWWKLLKKLGYNPKRGYRYPLKLLAGTFCTNLLLYYVLTVFLLQYLPVIKFYGEIVISENGIADQLFGQDTIDLLVAVFNVSRTGSFVSNFPRYRSWTIDGVYGTYYAFIVALSLAVFNGFIGTILQMVNYRKHSRMIKRGFRRDVQVDKIAAGGAVSAGFKYGAYVIVYPAWALAFSTLLIWIVLAVFVWVVVVPIKYKGNQAWIIRLIARLWPSWLYTIFIILSQTILARFVFLQNTNHKRQKKGKYEVGDPQGYMLLTNRRLYDLLGLVSSKDEFQHQK